MNRTLKLYEKRYNTFKAIDENNINKLEQIRDILAYTPLTAEASNIDVSDKKISAYLARADKEFDKICVKLIAVIDKAEKRLIGETDGEVNENE